MNNPPERIAAMPTNPDGLESTDCAGIIKGNADIVCEYKPPVAQESPPPLVYPIFKGWSDEG